MDADRLRELLVAVQRGELAVEAAQQTLSKLPYADLGYARVDHHRALRQGVPEVVLGEPKSVEQILGIVRQLMLLEESVIVTRVDAQKARGVLEQLPTLSHHALARVLSWQPRPLAIEGGAPVAVVTAGTSDIPVAEEAAETLRLCGVPIVKLFDVGVAGLHRLLGSLDELTRARALIVVAGMEGALPSVVGGLVAAPVVAVPTSVGYGAALGGLTALLGMLTSCAAGVTVVNIDNGFGAAMAVVRMLRASAGAPR